MLKHRCRIEPDWLIESLQHLLLRLKYFVQIAANKNHAIVETGRQPSKQRADDFHGTSLCFGQPSGVPFQRADLGILKVSARVVSIGRAVFVAQNRMATRLQHLHHQ